MNTGINNNVHIYERRLDKNICINQSYSGGTRGGDNFF